MKLELVAKTEGVGKYKGLTSEEIVSAIARHGIIKEDNGKLIKYLMKEHHWSPLDMINFTFEVETSRAIGRQWLRHSSIKPQEHCVSGNTEISFDMPSGGHYKLTIEDIYNKFHFGAKPLPNGVVVPMKERIKNMNIRVYDEDTKQIISSKIKDVFCNGIKPVYEVELECGRKIKCTKEHKFYENNSFKPLKELSEGSLVATNGVPVYQNYNWLKGKKEEALLNKEGVPFIVKEAGCSYHTIRKWLKKHSLTFSKKEVASMKDVWNKGLTGYKNKKWSEESKTNKRLNTPKGINHHSYRGGGRSERKYIQDFINSKRQDIYNLYGGEAICAKCAKGNCKIELHHIEPVCLTPFKAYDILNIIPLCESCHKKTHKEIGHYRAMFNLDELDWTNIRPDEITENLGSDTPKFYNKKEVLNNKKISKKSIGLSKIKSITYIGEEKVYDLEVEHKSHNYIANKILVHNSQRYSDRVYFENIELRLEDKINRQSSTESVANVLFSDLEVSGVTQEWTEFAVEGLELLQTIEDYYKKGIKLGVAKECMRSWLPECTTSTLTFNGTLRSWLSFLNVRLDHHSQKEILELAKLVGKALELEMPNVFAQIDWKNGMFM